MWSSSKADIRYLTGFLNQFWQSPTRPRYPLLSLLCRMGHRLGIQSTETPSITAFDHSPLQAGMMMTLETRYRYAPGNLMVHEENPTITESGYELLSTGAPSDIPVIG